MPRVAAAPPNGSLFDKIVVILMENEGLQNICNRNPPPCSGTNTPYMSSLANSNTIAQNYTALAHSSMPNYVALLGGNTSSSNNLPWRNLVDLLTGAGLTWKGYMESQPDSSGCDTSTIEPYNTDHNPFIQFQDITNNTARCSMIVRADPSGCVKTDCQLINDLNSPSPASFMWLTPNDCDNMHGSPICTNGCNTIPVTASCMTTDDTYLSTLVPNILNSTTFKNSRAALFITFDRIRRTTVEEEFCRSRQPPIQSLLISQDTGVQLGIVLPCCGKRLCSNRNVRILHFQLDSPTTKPSHDAQRQNSAVRKSVGRTGILCSRPRLGLLRQLRHLQWNLFKLPLLCD